MSLVVMGRIYRIKDNDIALIENNLPGKKSVLVVCKKDVKHSADAMRLIEDCFSDTYRVHTNILSEKQKNDLGITGVDGSTLVLRISEDISSKDPAKSRFDGVYDATHVLNVLSKPKPGVGSSAEAGKPAVFRKSGASNNRHSYAGDQETPPEILAAFGEVISFLAEKKTILLNQDERDKLLIKMAAAAKSTKEKGAQQSP